MKNFVRNLIIGKNNYIDSWCEFKQVMLSGQFILISILGCSLYMLVDVFLMGTITTLPVFLITIGLLFTAWYQHRKGHHCEANYFLFPTLSVAVYLFAASETPNTGLFILFIPIVLGAFAVFDYRMRLVSIFMAVGVYILFSLAYFTDYSILPQREYSEDEILVNIIMNFSFALPASVLAIYLMIRMNHFNALQLIESNKQLKKTNGELDRFVYSTSHDLRAPLASVLGLINLAEKSDLTEAQKYLGMMKDRIHSLEFFIKEITDFSRNNRVRVYREELNLSELVLSIWENLRYATEAQDIEFEIDFPNDLIVETDKMRLQVVLSNLISNAIRYHDNGKQSKFIRVGYHTTPRSFCISVDDNGQGIAPEYQKKIFDMFFRGNESSQGSGLGLYIVKETLAKLSGSIQLESVPHTGSSFRVIIPQR